MAHFGVTESRYGTSAEGYQSSNLGCYWQRGTIWYSGIVASSTATLVAITLSLSRVLSPGSTPHETNKVFKSKEI
ncbi:hypothetical protein H634G_11450 [Metarhizium anisopliae BRIP 53293]|uniref:Uncharacterized protein n=1 Tax=Metarhizium anisopliae BRIP 53293 TaxID=1291518 RepID=A0A0D9NHA5_METAN|nr:hypothetical protein H634G_11450 [Metarhizium anisopliae BRIP 53293]KJK84730.1 hypothetical protein H633G_11510 [Metarhizium anisopliae BRIP 53284]